MVWKFLRNLWNGDDSAKESVGRAPIPAAPSTLKSITQISGGLTFRAGAVSITGNFRKNNEDNFHVDDQARFFLVADGMGGQSAGERASELAIELISQRLVQSIDFQKSATKEIVAAIDAAIGHANMEIMALGELESSCRNMGTTIAFVLTAGKKVYVGGVGDSRVYLLRDGTLQQLTRDHSLTEALVEAGTISRDEAATHRYKNVLYRYLGSKDGGTGTEPKELLPESGDRLMLCSDGVTDGTSNDTIAEILKTKNDPQQAAEAIVAAAEQGGSKDNITCIVVYVD